MDTQKVLVIHFKFTQTDIKLTKIVVFPQRNRRTSGGDMPSALPAVNHPAAEGDSAGGGRRRWRHPVSVRRLHPHAATQRQQFRSF